MSQGSTQSTGSGPDSYLPYEILSVIPTDPYDQLDLARKITSIVIASRVSKLELEIGRLKQKMHEKECIMLELEDRVCTSNRPIRKFKLSKERDAMATTAKKLRHDLARLETFKRQLMQSLSDDNLSQAETVDIGTPDQSVPKSYPKKVLGMNDHMLLHSFSGSRENGNITDEASIRGEQRFFMTPFITPRLTPNGTPKIVSAIGYPRRFSAAGSPTKISGTTSSTKIQNDGQSTLSSWYPSSQQSSPANSPPRGRPPPGVLLPSRISLSYEQFSAFLSNIKELNAQKQSREETLKKAEQIFGVIDNQDLYLSFQGLLDRNIN